MRILSVPLIDLVSTLEAILKEEHNRRGQESRYCRASPDAHEQRRSPLCQRRQALPAKVVLWPICNEARCECTAEQLQQSRMDFLSGGSPHLDQRGGLSIGTRYFRCPVLSHRCCTCCLENARASLDRSDRSSERGSVVGGRVVHVGGANARHSALERGHSTAYSDHDWCPYFSPEKIPGRRAFDGAYGFSHWGTECESVLREGRNRDRQSPAIWTPADCGLSGSRRFQEHQRSLRP